MTRPIGFIFLWTWLKYFGQIPTKNTDNHSQGRKPRVQTNDLAHWLGLIWLETSVMYYKPTTTYKGKSHKSQKVLLLGEISPNFNLKILISISTYKGIFHGKKWPKIFRFWKNKIKSKSPDFYNKFQSIDKNIERFWFFTTFISNM